MKQVIVIKVYYKDPFMLCLFYLIFRFGKSPAQRFTSRHQRNDNCGARSIGKQGNVINQPTIYYLVLVEWEWILFFLIVYCLKFKEKLNLHCFSRFIVTCIWHLNHFKKIWHIFKLVSDFNIFFSEVETQIAFFSS